MCVTVVIACLVMTSCTTAIDGQPRPAEPSASSPGGEPAKAPKPQDRNIQAVTVALRTIDACGVLDLNAAKAAGNPKASLLATGPHSCMLVPTGTYSPGNRGVEVSIGDASNTFFSYSGAPVTIGGVKAYEYRDYHSSRLCQLYIPVSFTRAIKFKYDEFVEPTHKLELRVNVDPDNEPSDYGKGAVYTERRETQIAGKPAVTFWDKDKNAFDIYLSPFNDLTRKGNLHLHIQALHGRGDGSIRTVKLDQAKADTAIQVITQITQKYFAG